MDELLNLKLDQIAKESQDWTPEQQALLNQALKQSLTTSITPTPGFVLKTHILDQVPPPSEASSTSESSNAPNVNVVEKGTKIFINICQHSSIPGPYNSTLLRNWTAAEIEEASMGVDNGFRMAISLSDGGLRECLDSKGGQGFVVDACISSEVMKKLLAPSEEKKQESLIGGTSTIEQTTYSGFDGKRMKEFVCHLCMAVVEEKLNLSLSRSYSLPRMHAKGPLGQHQIYRTNISNSNTNNGNDLIMDLKENEVDNEQVFLKMPEYSIVEDLGDGNENGEEGQWPEYIIVTINIPLLQTNSSNNKTLNKNHNNFEEGEMKLEISPLSLTFRTGGGMYAPLKLDIGVPIVPGQSVAQYDPHKGEVSVTLYCEPLPASFMV